MVTLQVDNDFRDVVDGTEQVTLTDRAGVTSTISYAHQAAIEHEPVDNSAGTLRRLTVWQFPESEHVADIALGSTITDARAEVWTIFELVRQVERSVWKCNTRNLALEAGLTDHVRVIESHVTHGAHGEPQYAPRDVTGPVRAHIETLTRDMAEERNTRYVDGSYVIRVETALALLAVHYLVDTDGNTYMIESIEPTEIGELQSVIARRTPWLFAS